MKRPSSVVAFGSHLFVGFILLSLFIGTLGTEKKETKPAAAHSPADAKHPPPVAAHAAAGASHASDPKHASPSPAGAAASHAHPPNGGAAHAAEPKHAAAPAIKITDEANNVYSVCVERDVLPAPENASKDKLKAIAAKCDECGAAKCKAKCGGKEVNDACRTCIMQNCPPAK